MRIFLAWELGAHYGHLRKLLPVIACLRARGHEVLVAAKDACIAAELLQPLSIPFVQAPLPARTLAIGRDIASYADILAVHGFAHQETLVPLVQGWQRLLREHRADVVVLSHAPGAQLAARLCDLPALELGDGFEVPPLCSPYPCFRPWLGLPPSVLEESEARLLKQVNRLLHEHGKRPLDRLQELACSTRLLTTFPELDHYARERAHCDGPARYLGPLSTDRSAAPAVWPRRHQKNVFVYLKRRADIDMLLAALARLDANVVCVVPGLAQAVIRRHAAPHLAIHDRAIRLQPLLASCDLVVTHGGHGLTADCLLAGVPQLSLPAHIEQLLLAQCLVRNGNGLALLPAQLHTHFSATLAEMLATPRFAERARELAAAHREHDVARVAECVASLIEEEARR